MATMTETWGVSLIPATFKTEEPRLMTRKEREEVEAAEIERHDREYQTETMAYNESKRGRR